MNQSLEAWELVKARNLEEHEKQLSKTLWLGIIILIAVMFVLFFISNPVKWPLMAFLALLYTITRAI
ncbi:hypothetical protein GF345_05125 [Candidatus Woesearchaeota archaeon]|nr:hypothetical protein [Candidatus Woesearchaeota archaeon]